MNKECRLCKTLFTISSQDEEFYKRVKAPLPTLCPDCRFQKRLAYRNERTLYPSVCGLCNKDILSLYNKEDGLLVYCNDCWWSDKWDPTDYSQEIDWNRSFLDQWDELRHKVPQLALSNISSENSEYTNMSADNKNCYLLFAAENNENCCYGKLIQDSTDCYDCNFIYNCELCYGSINLHNCYRSAYLQDCQDSRECWFSTGLKACSNVFLCSNLHNKEYCIRNKSVSKEEYEIQMTELTKDYDSIKQCYKEWRELNKGRIVKYANNIKSDGCTGDYLTNCKRVEQCFDVTGGQDCKYVTDALDPRDTYDASFIYYKPELIYDCLSMLQCYNVQYSVFAFYCSDSQYCDQVHNSNNLFLSSCVKKKEYLILNKQYSEVEYKEVLVKVIDKMKQDNEYGELPDMEHSLFRYNDTVAYEYFPLSEEEVRNKNLRWNDSSNQAGHSEQALTADQLLLSIDEVSEDILDKLIICKQSSRVFQIKKSELEFYKNLHLPLPRVHPEERHQNRMRMRNPRHLFSRQCMCQNTDHDHTSTSSAQCGEKIITTYNKDRQELVYCDSCYKKEYY